jgi:outer membrane receptor protein involved in Fe transport
MEKALVVSLMVSVACLFWGGAVSTVTAADTDPGKGSVAQSDEDQETGYQVFDLGEVYVTGKTTPTIEKAAILEEVTAEQIKATNSKTVAEALSFVPGIRVSTARKNEPNIQVHGFDQSNTLVLVDGVPYYETNFGKLDLSQIPVDNVAKIQVTEGVSSVLYGPNALGGVINIITKKPGEKPSTEGFVEYGPNSIFHATVSHGMKKGPYNYWLNYTHNQADAWEMSDDFHPRTGSITRRPGPTTALVLESGDDRLNSDFKSDSFWAKVGVEPNPDTEYYLSFNYIARDKGYPPSIDSVQVFTSRPAFSHFARIPKYDDWGLDFVGQQKVLKPLTLKPKAFYHNHRDDYDSYLDQTFSQVIAVSTYKDYVLGGAVTADYQPVDWNILRLGFNFKDDSHRERDDSYLPFAQSLSRTGSVSVENEYNKVKNLSIVAGAGFDWFDITKARRNITDGNTGDFLSQTDLTKPDTMNGFAPMAGVTYNITESLRLFGSAARKLRFPTLQQLYSTSSGNTDLKEEKSNNFTAGAARQFSTKGQFQFAFFYYGIDDFITRDAPGPLGGIYRNAAKIRICGFDVNGEARPTRSLLLGMGYTYNNASDRSEGRVTDEVVNVPEHNIDFRVAYTIPRIQSRLDFTATYMASVFSQLPTPTRPTQGVLEADDYFVSNLRISKSFLKRYEAYFAVDNLFDSEYEPESGFPAPGRNFFFGFGARF